MLDPIGTYSPEAVIDAIEADLVGASLPLGRTVDGVVYRGADVTWVYTGGGSPSRVLGARFAPAAAEDRVAQIGDYFRSCDAPVRWLVGPTSWPPDLSSLLQADGFDAGEVWTGTARGLVGAPDLVTGGAHRIERVTTAAQSTAWTALSAVDSALPVTPGGSDGRFRFYLATDVAGRSVGRGMAHLAGDVVGLHWILSTEGSACAEAIGRRALADARHAGARLAVLTASGATRSVAMALGFRPYCQLTAHAWPPADRVEV